MGIAPFLNHVRAFVPPLTDLVLLIPQSLLGIMGSATAVLTGLFASALPVLSPGGLRRLSRIGAAVLPMGLLLVSYLQLTVVVRVPFEGGRKVMSEIVGRTRIPGCLCPSTLSDTECAKRSIAPAALEKCWGSGPIKMNQNLWSLGYLLTIAGCCGCAGLLYSSGSPRREERPTSPSGPPERRVFFSYSSRDRDFVARLARDLTARGVAVWWDAGELNVGDSLPREIGDAIAGSAWFGIVLSPDAVSSRWVGLELDTALTLEVETATPAILPILYRPCTVPASLRSKVHADYTVSYEAGLAALLRTLGMGSEAPHGDRSTPMLHLGP